MKIDKSVIFLYIHISSSWNRKEDVCDASREGIRAVSVATAERDIIACGVPVVSRDRA